MWMFCSAGISNSVSRGARPSQQPAGGSPTDLWRPARKLFTHWKILNKYFVFLSVAKLDLTLSKHSMVGVVSEEAQCAVFNWWVEWWKGVDVRTGCPTNTRPSLWVSRLVTSEWNEECGSMQYGGETGTVCRYTTHCHDTMSHMTPSPRDNVVTQRGDNRHSALSTWLIWSPHLSPPPGWPRCSPYDVSLQTCGHSPVCDGHISTGVTIHHWPGSPAHNESWFVWLPAPHPQLSAAGWRDSRLGAAWENVTWLTRAAPSYLCPDASWLSLSDIHESSWFLLSLPSWNSNDTPKHCMFMVTQGGWRTRFTIYIHGFMVNN